MIHTRDTATGEETVTHQGLTCKVWENEVRVMSDVYDIATFVCVYQPETLNFRTIVYVPGDGTQIVNAWADGGEELAAIYAAHEEGQRLASYYRSLEEAEKHALVSARTPKVGREGVVVRGRKVPIGTRGVIVSTHDNRYNLSVGIRDAEGKTHYTAASNVEVRAWARLSRLDRGGWVCKACDLHAKPLTFEDDAAAAVHCDEHLEAGEQIDERVLAELSGREKEIDAQVSLVLGKRGWRRNEYPGKCAVTGAAVAPRRGFIRQDASKRWRTYSHSAAVEAVAQE